MTTPSDEPVRLRVRSDLAAPIALEAGAGTGKTTSLVDRIMSLLRAGVPLRRLAVVTFLRAAAEEMRVRLRAQLAMEEGEWARAAEADLPAAAIGTIHSFAQRLLAQEAEAAGWDPGTRILEEDEALALARHHFRLWLETAAAADPAPLVALRALGVNLTARSVMALALRLPAGALGAAPAPAPVPDDEAAAMEAAIARAVDTLAALAPACRNPEDKALSALPALRTTLAELGTWSGRERLAAACRLDLPSPKAGNKQNWKGAEEALTAWRAALADLASRQAALRAAMGAEAAHALLEWLLPYGTAAAAERQRAGVATFDDLMRRAVDLLRDDEVRRRAAGRYDAVLVDEFQDTDPLQARLLNRLAGPPAPAGEGEVARLFVVGDPKQAIYRFRGADLDTYLAFTGTFAPEDRLPLVTNHRARTPLLAVPNRICPPLMEGGAVVYRPLEGGRGEAPSDAPAPLQVLVPAFGSDAARPASTIAEAREREAALVAAHLRSALDDPWRIDGRAITPGDIALLFRSRTAYPAYVAALDRFGIPHAAERDQGLWRSPVARDAGRLVVAAARPRSALAVAAALRTMLVGASDEDLWRFARAGGRFDLAAAPPPAAPEVLREAIAALAWAAEARNLRPSARLLGMIERLDLGAAAVLADGENGARTLARVVETVRALEQRRPGGMGAMADVAAALAGVGFEREDAPVPDPAPAADPQPDGGAVRLLTVHEAKGNQFPVVVLCDVWGGPRSGGEHLYLSARDGRAGLRLTSPWEDPPLESPGTAALREADAAAEQGERVRLLYVALTRTREVTVIPDVPVKSPAKDSVGALVCRAAGAVDDASVAAAFDALALGHVRITPAAEPPSPAERIDVDALAAPPADLRALRDRLSRRAALTPVVRPSGAESDGAGGRAPTTGDGRTDRDLARRIGLAVHAVVAGGLEDDRLDLAAVGAREARRQGLDPEGEAEALRLSRAALAHPLLKRAKAAKHRAVEAAVSAKAPDGGLILGRADLVFEDRAGVVIVDLKTDRLPQPTPAAALAHTAARGYDRQLALYAYAVQSATGRRVREAWVLYARHGVEARVELGSHAAAATRGG